MCSQCLHNYPDVGRTASPTYFVHAIITDRSNHHNPPVGPFECLVRDFRLYDNLPPDFNLTSHQPLQTNTSKEHCNRDLDIHQPSCAITFTLSVGPSPVLRLKATSTNWTAKCPSINHYTNHQLITNFSSVPHGPSQFTCAFRKRVMILGRPCWPFVGAGVKPAQPNRGKMTVLNIDGCLCYLMVNSDS